MYNSRYLDPDFSAESLQRKVQFDIRLYFARRGSENMEKMKKTTFKVEFNSKTETWYIIKAVDELTKNHKDIDEKISGIMPENKGDRLCPVRSYNKYIEHLNPDNEFLWQYPLQVIKAANPNVWFGLQKMGKNTLSEFMPDVSTECKLSKRYTNHSVRVTGATILTRMNFSASEIMSVTGHKSVQSLARYQKTQDKQKINMGNVMHQSMTRNEENIIVPGRKQLMQNPTEINAIPYNVNAPMTSPAVVMALPPILQQNKENVSDSVVPFQANFSDDEVPDFDLVSILNEMEGEKNPSDVVQQSQNTTTTNTKQVLNNVPKSMFANCTIQNVTFNINNK